MKCLTWNVLAQKYAEPYEVKDWSTRLNQILAFLTSKSFDLICLQEVDLTSFENDYKNLFDEYAYSVHKIDKKRSSTIGNAILWKKTKIGIIEEKFGSCAIFTKLKYLESDCIFLIINVHLKAGLNSGLSTRISQLKSVVNKCKSLNVEKMIICGDFNDDFSDDALASMLSANNYVIVNDELKKTCMLKDGSLHNFDHIVGHGVSLNYIPPPFIYKKIPNNTIPSDHLPVVFDLIIK